MLKKTEQELRGHCPLQPMHSRRSLAFSAWSDFLDDFENKFLETLCASSTQTKSTPSNDLMESIVCSSSPENRNSEPLRPRISESVTV